MDDFVAAREDYKVFVSHDDASAEIWYNLGLAQRNTGDLKGALISYTEALELDPSYYPAYINRGNVYLALNEFKNAMADFNSALEFGDIPLAYKGRGIAHYGLKEYDQSIDDYEKALKLVPSDTNLYCYISLSYLEDHKYQDSIEAAQKSDQTTDQGCNSQVLNEVLARSYYALGNYDQALLHINEALKGSDYTLGHYYRGIIYQAVGKNQEAIQDLELFLAFLGTSELAKDEAADAKVRLAQLKQ
jgi:tetratricopeptide (TPR) repeat protein